MMPDGDGFETCRELTTHPQTKDIPVIFITTHPQTKDISVIFITALNDSAYVTRGFRAGAKEYIVKPFSREELIARVQVHLEARRLTQPVLRLSSFGMILEEAILFFEAIDRISYGDIQVLLIILICHDRITDCHNVIFLLRYYLLYLV
jgi:DNA-binding response OmpR family regulator